jgi:hypothetical protein
MPNRILKESICTSENVDRLSAFQETVFYRLIVTCDDYGRMDARPKLLASKLFPLKDIRSNQIEDALRALTSAELVTLYEVDGKPFLQMKTWDRHQQVRAKKSKYPAPESGKQTSDINCNQMISDASKCPRNPIQSESNPNPNPNPNAKTRFAPPTRDEVAGYIAEKGYSVDPDRWMAYYESNGWRVGKNPMKDWKAAVRTWATNGVDSPKKTTTQAAYSQRQYEERKPDQLPDWVRDMIDSGEAVL